MGTTRNQFTPRSFVPAATNGPQIKLVEGANFPVSALAFDAATLETAYLQFLAQAYGSGNLSLKLQWYADSASSGAVVWGAAIAVITPDTDSQDIETKAFATAQTVTDTHLGTTGKRVHTCTISITNLDSIAADDLVALKLYRDAANGSDTMTGDVLLVSAVLEYSDT